MKHLIISGDVHGVGFRQFIKYHAKKLNIKGWVKNIPDGNVEAVFSGSSENIEKMINYSKNGPALADVKSIDVKELSDEHFEDFQIIK